MGVGLVVYTPHKMMQNLEQTLLKLRKDPVLFVESVLGATPQKWQREALKSVVEHDRISVKSGHGVGKSAYLSWLTLWWLLTHYPCKIAITANTAHQLNDVLWSEINKWAKRLPDAFYNQLEIKSDKISLKGVFDSFASFRTSRRETPEALQGFHSENMLFICEEASGIPNVVFEVGEGSMSTKGAKTVMTGNPTRSDGYFYESFHSMRDSWKCFTVSCRDSDYVDENFVTDMARKYGEDSNIFRVRVLGEFPLQSDDVLLPLHLVEAATKRDIEPSPTTSVVWGVDPARMGDDRSCLAKRKGQVLLEPVKSWTKKDLMELAGIIVNEYELTRWEDRPEFIYVDSIGIGAGLADRLSELDLPAIGIAVSESPSMKDKFMRLRDELYWNCRSFFEGRDVHIPQDDVLISELTNIRYKYLSTGKLKIEAKDEIKRRNGGRSCDVADSFVLTFAGDGALASGSQSKWTSKVTVKPDLRWVV